MDTRDTPEQAELRRSARQLARELGPTAVGDLDDATRAKRLAARSATQAGSSCDTTTAQGHRWRAAWRRPSSPTRSVAPSRTPRSQGRCSRPISRVAPGRTPSTARSSRSRHRSPTRHSRPDVPRRPRCSSSTGVTTTVSVRTCWSPRTRASGSRQVAFEGAPAAVGRLGPHPVGAHDPRGSGGARGLRPAAGAHRRRPRRLDRARSGAHERRPRRRDAWGARRHRRLRGRAPAVRRADRLVPGGAAPPRRRALPDGGLARASALHASWAVDALPPHEARAAGRVAKAYCARAARTVCETAIQVHGGIGNTWECIAHVYLRRALLSSQWFGDDGVQLRGTLRRRATAAAERWRTDGLS